MKRKLSWRKLLKYFIPTNYLSVPVNFAVSRGRAKRNWKEELFVVN